MILYCIDKEHPLYGRRIRSKESTDLEYETEYVDALTNVPFALRLNQISIYPPRENQISYGSGWNYDRPAH